jgi:hypothetical protein
MFKSGNSDALILREVEDNTAEIALLGRCKGTLYTAGRSVNGLDAYILFGIKPGHVHNLILRQSSNASL